MNAVHVLGIDKSTPKEILNLMQVEGMTRENVSSHFQKYRCYLKRLAGVSDNDALTPSVLQEAHEKAIMHHTSQQMMAADQQQQQQQMFMGGFYPPFPQMQMPMQMPCMPMMQQMPMAHPHPLPHPVMMQPMQWMQMPMMQQQQAMYPQAMWPNFPPMAMNNPQQAMTMGGNAPVNQIATDQSFFTSEQK